MSRLITAIKTDIIVQARTKLYHVGVVSGILGAVVIIWLANPEQLMLWILSLMLVMVGATTIIYVSAMILFEKEQGTLNAHIVSPLRTSEYLWSKTVSLGILAMTEAVVLVSISMFTVSFTHKITLPNIPLLFVGITMIGIVYTLVGIVIIVRFNKITDSLFLLSAVATVLQVPVLYFIGWMKFPVFLVIPTSAPTMLIKGTYIQLANWEWIYAIGYTVVGILGFAVWAHLAFRRHIIIKVR